MTRTRLAAWVLLATASCLALAPAVTGQDPPLPKRPNVQDVNDARDVWKGIPKDKLQKVRDQLDAYAKYHVDVISHPNVYRAIQDPTKTFKETPPKLDDVFGDLERRFVIEPNPAVKATDGSGAIRAQPDNADYIREFGAAFDNALKTVIDTHADRIVKVNAARLYVIVCKSGAAAHWPTVTAWLTNANTPTEIKHYALQAAANLLAAYDLFEYKTRRHAVSKEPRAEADKEIGALVAAVEKCITDPNALVQLPDGKVENATEDQLAVIGFVRRQAVRALGNVRFMELPGPEGKTIYPVGTLVKVAMSDPALVPLPSPAECGEAVIGLCNMAPSFNQKPTKGFNPDALVEAVATGVIAFAGPRADPLNKSVAWRGYSLRIADAFRNWPPLFDPLFDPTRPTQFETKDVPAAVNDLIARVRTNVLNPIDKVGVGGGADLSSPVNIPAMQAYLKSLQAKPKRPTEIITGVPATAFPAPPK